LLLLAIAPALQSAYPLRVSRAITRAVHCLRLSPLLLLPGPPSSNTSLVPTLHNHPILSIDPSVACFCQFARHQLGDVHLSLPTVDIDLSPLLCDFASMPSIADPNPKAKHDRLVERRHRISGACSDDKGLYYAHLSRRSRFATIPLPACYRCSSSYHPPPPPVVLLLPALAVLAAHSSASVAR
jgi:hypothetical protein